MQSLMMVALALMACETSCEEKPADSAAEMPKSLSAKIVHHADGYELQFTKPVKGISTVTWQNLRDDVTKKQPDLRVVLCFAVWRSTDINHVYGSATKIRQHPSMPSVVLCPYDEAKELQATFPLHEAQNGSLLWAVTKNGKVLDFGYGYKLEPIYQRLKLEAAEQK